MVSTFQHLQCTTRDGGDRDGPISDPLASHSAKTSLKLTTNIKVMKKINICREDSQIDLLSKTFFESLYIYHLTTVVDFLSEKYSLWFYSTPLYFSDKKSTTVEK